MHVIGPPRDAYVYHYLFNHSRLVYYLQTNRGCNTSHQKPHLDEIFPALAAKYIHNLLGLYT